MSKKKILYGSLIVGGIILLVIMLVAFIGYCHHVSNECGLVDAWECKIDWDDDEDIYDCWTEELAHVYVKPENVIVRYCDDEHTGEFLLALKREIGHDFVIPKTKDVYYLYIFIGIAEEE